METLFATRAITPANDGRERGESQIMSAERSAQASWYRSKPFILQTLILSKEKSSGIGERKMKFLVGPDGQLQPVPARDDNEAEILRP